MGQNIIRSGARSGQGRGFLSAHMTEVRRPNPILDFGFWILDFGSGIGLDRYVPRRTESKTKIKIQNIQNPKSKIQNRIGSPHSVVWLGRPNLPQNTFKTTPGFLISTSIFVSLGAKMRAKTPVKYSTTSSTSTTSTTARAVNAPPPPSL